MKYEISDLLNEKYKYGLTLLRIHNKANKGIIATLILKISMSDYTIIHFLFIIISSMGLLILSSDFSPDYDKYMYFSSALRYLTPYNFIKKLQISHYAYIIICFIIFVICIIRILSTYNLIRNANNFHITELKNIKYNIIVRLLNHFLYIFFSYIIEFLSFIYYIEIFPNNFIIKKDTKIHGFIHKSFFVLNSIFIIVYNINNYFFINIANRLESDNSYPLKLRIPSLKFYILIIVQNLSLIHPIKCHLSEQFSKIFCIIYAIIALLILLWLFLITIKKYNYDNLLNSLLSFIGEFSFVSIIVEIILFLFSIRHESKIELIYFFICKLGINICLFYSLKKMYQKSMLKIVHKRLFYNNPYKHPFDNDMKNSVFFLRELFAQKI